MKYKAGDKVRIKSLDWYNENKDSYGHIPAAFFDELRSRFCGTIQTIANNGVLLGSGVIVYAIEDAFEYIGEEAIEVLAEEEGLSEFDKMYQEMVKQAEDKYKVKPEHPKTEEEVGLVDNLSSRWVNEFNLPDGYIFKDENGNVINTMKIVLEKKKEYPKTYEECCEVLGIGIHGHYALGYESDTLSTFQNLIICRDAYWKIAGEEMGLGKPWEPDWENIDHDSYPTITRCGGKIIRTTIYTHDCPFSFPTAEMRDAFKENFDPDIEICKEFL